MIYSPAISISLRLSPPSSLITTGSTDATISAAGGAQADRSFISSTKPSTWNSGLLPIRLASKAYDGDFSQPLAVEIQLVCGFESGFGET